MANFNFNKVILGGRLTGDPELKQTTGGVYVCSFSVAVNRRYQSQNAEGGQSQADFINVVAWRQSAEFVHKYFRKGSSICIVGSIQTRTWNDQQGQKRYATEVVADEINFVDSKSEGAQAGYGAAPQNTYTPDNYTAPSFSTTADSSPKFEELANEDDLPF